MTVKLAGIEASKRPIITPLLDDEFEAALTAAAARPTDESPWERLEAAVVGSGPAWISTNGRTTKGTWKKTAITKPTQFYDAKGNEVTLTIGQTFVQVVTTSTTGYPVSFKAGSDTPPGTPVPSASTAN